MNTVLRALARVVTDRRWAPALCAMALCFGLFLGVAIGPGAPGSLAGGAGQVIAVSAPAGGGGAEPEAEEAGWEEPLEEEFGGAAESFPEESFPSEEFAPVEAAPEAEPEPRAPPAGETEPAEEESEAVALKGTVVRANPASGSYTLASASGELVSVHAPKLPQAGAKLAVEATPLPNNTFGEETRKQSGSAAQASFGGVVTYVKSDPAAPAYTVSGRGSSLLVHAAAGSDPAALPGQGSYVKVVVGIEKQPALASEAPPPAEAPLAPPVLPEAPPPACAPDPTLQPPIAPAHRLVERKRELEPTDPATYFDLAGVVTALCPASGQILLSADDLRESGADLVVAVPAKLKTAKLKLGDSLLATAEAAEPGALTLSGLASDEGRKGAEDTKSAQGDLAR